MIGSPAAHDDLPARYTEYLDRVAQELGEIKVGTFAKYSGRMIKKLSFEEFTSVYIEYTELLVRYHDSLARGDTVEDLMLMLMREQSASLVLPPPKL